MLSTRRTHIFLFFLTTLLCSCQLVQQNDIANEKENSSQQAKATPPQDKESERIIGYPITGNRTLSINPQNHQPAELSAQATSEPRSAATTTSPPRQTPPLQHPVAAPAATQLDTPALPTSTVRVATGGQSSPWLSDMSPPAGGHALPDLALGDAPFSPSAMLISPMRHPKTPGVNTPAEEDGSTKRELAPRPNQPELRGLRAPKLKPTVPLPHATP